MNGFEAVGVVIRIFNRSLQFSAEGNVGRRGTSLIFSWKTLCLELKIR